MELETTDGQVHSVMLQNAETVKLLGPSMAGSCSTRDGSSGHAGDVAGVAHAWVARPVTELVPGEPVFVLRAAAARHTGIAVEEFVVER